MHLKTIVQEIQALPLDKKFFVMEQTLKSIKKEELHNKSQKGNFKLFNTSEVESPLVNEKSLAKDWLSDEDNRWDNLL